MYEISKRVLDDGETSTFFFVSALQPFEFFVIVPEMEPQTASPEPRKNSMVIPVSVAALIVIGIIGYYLYSSNSNSANTTTQNTNSETNVTVYRDGNYSATGSYISPGGPREISITLTITDGKITDSTFTGGADDPTSQRFQGEFAEGYKAMIVGKNVNEVNLSKVSGSSLTPKGFTDALNKIKTEAKS